MNTSENKQAMPGAAKFADVLESERKIICGRRERAENPDEKMQLAGLAFSGGGIRSAVFNLGFIQGLANRNALHVFDYLSTVSGGGYIGGWLSALLKRRFADKHAGEAEMQTLQRDTLKTPQDKGKPDATGFAEVECRAVRFLRRYSNYLTPRLGLSGDTLALISLMVRNVMVMQLLLVSMLVTGFAGLLLMKQIGSAIEKTPALLFGIAAAIIALFIFALYSALRLQKKWSAPRTGDETPASSVTFQVIVPALSSGILTAVALGNIAPASWNGWGAMAAALIYAAVWWLQPGPKSAKIKTGILGGAATLGLLLYLLLSHAVSPLAIAIAPPIAMAAFSLAITVHLALAGTAITEQSREWWARLGGQGMLLALGWTLAFTFLLYAPPLMQYGMDEATHWLMVGGGAWSALTWIGARLAQSKDTGADDSAPMKEILAMVAPWVFLAGLLGLVAWGMALQLPGIALSGDTLSGIIAGYHRQLDVIGLAAPAIALLVAGLLFWVLLKFVDLNLFSAHSFYANRLARTFMGASQDVRHPNPYTGFDLHDDLPFADLAGQRPIHLINTTLNLTGGEDLAWQTRRGACFTFTPGHSGYTTRDSRGVEFGGGLITLATAVAVSGAAASPNMGFHTATSVAALLTAFNLRLARWCPNPEKDEWDKSAPATSAKPLFSELFGDTSGKNNWVNLSDGGHFENLGIYEPIRRRAALILVTDVGADPSYRFDDLAMAVRKIWVDFGVRVEIDEQDLDAIRPKTGKDADENAPRFSGKNWAIGRICYPDPESKPGYLIYVKSAIGADVPIDIRQYRDAHPAFPHESTADQWFDEDQFEAYRHLGQIIAENLVDDLRPEIPKDQKQQTCARELIAALYDKAKACFDQKKAANPCHQPQPTTTQGDKP